MSKEEIDSQKKEEREVTFISGMNYFCGKEIIDAEDQRFFLNAKFNGKSTVFINSFGEFFYSMSWFKIVIDGEELSI